MLSVVHISTRTFHVCVKLQELPEFVIVSQIIITLYLIQHVPFIKLIQHYSLVKILTIQLYGQINQVKICI
jgi:hypothetical protein